MRSAVGKRLDLDYQDMGEQKVKNIEEPARAYKVVMAAEEEAKAKEAVKPELELPDKPSIAVLPFTNMSGDAEQEYFIDGIDQRAIHEGTSGSAKLYCRSTAVCHFEAANSAFYESVFVGQY